MPANTSQQTTPLIDPLLKPFLSESFSASEYLNTTLLPLLPPPSLNPHPPAKPATAEPLSTLSSQATTLLSTLDLQTQILITTLQTATDEILRLAPRLGYEVDVLRADVVSLANSLDGELAEDVRLFAHDEVGGRPEVLEELRMLSRVRGRLEDVVKVFGHAMEWRIEDGGDAEGEGGATDEEGVPGKKGSGGGPIEEVLYHLSSGDLDGARGKVAELRGLCQLFEGTVEGPARNAVVEALEGKIRDEEGRRKRDEERQRSEEKGHLDKEREAHVDERVEGTSWAGGREGYYGLINQLSRMRGNMT